MKAVKSSVDVFGEKWSVVYSPGEDEKNRGYCDSENKVIFINSNTCTTKKQFMTTLLHELFHATLHETSIDQMEISYDCEQAIVENIAKILVKNFDIKCKKKLTKKKK